MYKKDIIVLMMKYFKKEFVLVVKKSKYFCGLEVLLYHDQINYNLQLNHCTSVLFF